MSLTTEKVWAALDGAFFGVLAFVNRRNEPRSTGVCFVVSGRSLWISTDKMSWKARHIAHNPNISMTVTIPKRVPFLPFIKIPPAAVTFRGEATVLDVGNVDPAIFERLPLGKERDPQILEGAAVIQVVPRGEFVTYGIDMPITQMRKHEAAHGRAATGTDAVQLQSHQSA